MKCNRDQIRKRRIRILKVRGVKKNVFDREKIKKKGSCFGSLIIQTKYQYSDRELVEQLTENPYYQYFIGLSGYKEEPPIDASTLVLFHKRLKIDVIMEANEYMLDATCVPSNIRYPQDVSLLNEARENWKRLSFVSAKHMDFSDPACTAG